MTKAELYELIYDLYDESPCRLDHHGYCQEHVWFSTEVECPHARAKKLLAEPKDTKLNDSDKLELVEFFIRNVKLPSDGTYEDMYFQAEGELRTLLRRLRKVVIEGDPMTAVVQEIIEENEG